MALEDGRQLESGDMKFSEAHLCSKSKSGSLNSMCR